MVNSLQSALIFLINTIFDLYLFILAVRVILVYTGANYFHPLVQFIVKLTNFLVKPLQRFVPNIKKIETASLLLILILAALKFTLLILVIQHVPSPIGILILVVADTLKLFILTFFYAIIVQAILTWVQPFSPFAYVLNQFVSPIMRPIQRIIPPVAGIDISPIPALILLQLLIILLVNPLMGVGYSLSIAA